MCSLSELGKYIAWVSGVSGETEKGKEKPKMDTQFTEAFHPERHTFVSGFFFLFSSLLTSFLKISSNLASYNSAYLIHWPESGGARNKKDQYAVQNFKKIFLRPTPKMNTYQLNSQGYEKTSPRSVQAADQDWVGQDVRGG